MYHKWLDWWDERRARRGDGFKKQMPFALDGHLAFPDASEENGLSEFCVHADQALRDPAFFAEPGWPDLKVDRSNEWIRFQSSILTGVDKNDFVWAKVTAGRASSQALVIFHHWNASSRYPQIANFFARRGVAVVEMAMPYHLERSRPSSSHADFMLSPNLGRTIQSMRQAVLDGRTLIRLLKDDGYEDISVLGMSLGSWVAGLIAAHDPNVKNAALFLTAASLADMVWTGRATRHIRASLETKIDLADLRSAWCPLNLENHADKFARSDLDLLLVLAKRDTVVVPELSKKLIAALGDKGATPNVLALNCGHYSLSLPPYIVWAGLSVARMFSQK